MKARQLALATLAVATLAIFAACGGCRGEKMPARAADPLAFLPAAPEGALHVPRLAQLGATIAALEKTRLATLAAAALGAKDTEQLAAPVVRQLGFDPRRPDGFAAAGIDGARGLAVGVDEAGAQILVLPVADEGAFGAYVASLAGRLGAPTRGAATWQAPAEGDAPPAKPVEVTTFAAADGAVRVAWGARDGWAVVAADADAVAAVGRALSRPWERSLANDPVWRRMAGKLGERDLTVWMAKGLAQDGRRGRRFDEGLALGISASGKGLNLRALVPRGPLELAMLAPAGKVAGLELVELLPADDFLALRLGGEPRALQPVIESLLPRGFFVRLKRAGIDPASDVLEQLQPGIVVGLGLSPEIDLSGGIPTDARVSRTNPFRFFVATIFAKVKDPARAAEVLERLAAGAAHFGMEVRAEEQDGAKTWRATYAAGEGMRWTLHGDTLVAAGGPGAFEKALQRLAAEDAAAFSIADPAAARVFRDAASAAHLDVPRLARALRGIPESAYGIGGFRIKAIVETWVGLLDEVRGVTASFSVDDEGLVVDADLGLT